MATNTFNACTIEKVLLSLGYTVFHEKGNYKHYRHENFSSIALATSGTYQEKQVIKDVVAKLPIGGNFEKFCDMYKKCV